MTDVIAEEYKGYSTFAEVENLTLRAYNQYMVLRNMGESKLLQLQEEYLNNLNVKDKLRLMAISYFIKQHGVEETQRQLNEMVDVNG